MQRQLWGECAEAGHKSKDVVPVAAKWGRLQELKKQKPIAADQIVTIDIKNPLVTQTIEVMKQTEMLQSLIDTYSNKTDSTSYLVNPCQIIPEVDFPPENVANLVTNDKFTKPIWFASPQDTPFARGVPRVYPQITTEICRAAIRKAVCGQLCVAGFADTAESALVLLTDAVEEFIINFMQQVRDVYANNANRDTEREVDIPSLEKAYFTLTNSTLMQVHNYYKHNIIARNRSEIAEFNGVFEEYDKLMKESQRMQKSEYQEAEYLNIVEVPPGSESMVVGDPSEGVSTESVMLSVPHSSYDHDADSNLDSQYVNEVQFVKE